MKLATFELNGQARPAIVEGELVHIISGPRMPETMLALIQGGKDLLAQIARARQAGQFSVHPLSSGRLLAPVNNPEKVMAIGHNYMDHIREQNAPVPASPMLFAKFSSSIIGPGETITWDRGLTQQVDIEAELGIVIGREARRVSVEQALEHVFGYTVLNDVSARDLQSTDKQWVRAKSLDTFCPLGPVIVTADEIPDPQNLRLSSRINDFVMQDSNTREMIFSVAFLVSFLSQAFTLKAGDLIASGTPQGVGVFRKPQIFLKDGDVVAIEVEKIGRLVNPVRITG
jgi:2-keto-4-pentenoate hydratase/2-oxohepta-3-ene-1,7-dioic acid hydratase in catechol pathway